MIQKITNENKMKFVYLNNLAQNSIGISELSQYFGIKKEFSSIRYITHRLFISLQNTQMMPNVIGFRDKERVNTFIEILFDFDCKKIVKSYNDESLYSIFCSKFVVNNKESKRNLWRRYAKSVLSAAKFMTAFESADDFDKFITRFDYNELTSAALPMLLKLEIHGLGFPLACDFLKELGYSQYPKPDVHIIKIFVALNFCDNNEYEAYKAVIKMAEINNDSAYNVDKVFWLIGSGNFYIHDINVRSHRAEFIQSVKKELTIIS